MKEFELDRLMADVVAEAANPEVSEGFEQQVKARSLAMNGVRDAGLDGVLAGSNVLVFGSLGRTGGRGMSRGSVTAAALFNVAALLLLVAQVRSVRLTAPAMREMETLVAPPTPPPLPPSARFAAGGGGQPGVAPVSQGNPPKFSPEQLNPPKAPPLEEPKIHIDPTVDVQADLKMATTNLPNIGMPNAPAVGTSLGNGRGFGIGSGDGGGIGPGGGGNFGGGLKAVGGGVSAPVVLFAPEPEFSEEARKAKVSGNVLVYLQVDTLGRPTHVRVLRGIGLGLDEKALAAVAQYRFKPAMENGRPVPVEMQVNVDFNIY